MKQLGALATMALLVATPAAANHIFNLDVPFDTRGACEAEVAALNADDSDTLQGRYPGLFSNKGEVASFLTRAFTCELDQSDGQWYIEDHRQEVIDSDWFQRRQG